MTDCLAKNNINIRALSLADTSDFGIVRMIVDDPDKAYKALKDGSFTVHYTEVVALGVRDEPGALSKALAILSEADINVEYVYAFYAPLSGYAVNVLRTDKMEEAINVLTKGGLNVLDGQDVYGV